MNMLLTGRLPRLLSLLCAVAALMLSFNAALAQTDAGRITGRVTDQNGAIVSGASVSIRNNATGEERTAVATDEGIFNVAALKASIYTVTVEGNGLTAKVENAKIAAGQELNLPVTLQPSGVSASVDVSAGTSEAAIDTSSARMGANVNQREVEGLPINGRQLSQLYLQAPGSVNTGSGTFGDIRFSGRAVEQNIVRYDGIEGSAIIDASPGNLNGEVASPFRLQSSLENVQEFRVDSNNYPAEYGTGTGGQINVVTKSGSNQFRGSVFEYLRNDALDAANFFDNIIGQKSPLRLNQFGGSIGGPIIKNRAFFFFSYEGYRLRAGINSIEQVPGLASRICAPPVGTGTTPCNAAIVPLIPAFRAANTVTLRTGAGADLFDVIQLQSKSIVDENSIAARFDFRFNDKHSMYVRYFRDQGTNEQPEGVTGRRVFYIANPQNGVVALQSVLKPTLLNEFKFGFNGAYSRINGFAPVVNGIDLSRIILNISGSVASFNLPGQGTGAGTAVAGGLVRANSSTNGRGQPYTPYSLSFIDNLNWTKGNHSFKLGGELRAIRLYTDRLGGTTYTYSNIAGFLSNSPQSINYVGDLSNTSPFTGVSGQRKAEQEYYILYGQDEWKLRPNLTLNYGLRYEYYTPLREASNGQVLFDITTGMLRSASEAAFKTSKTNFGPRVALTWSPNLQGRGFFGGGRSVVRAGFGIYYGPGQTEDQIQPIESDRISATFTSSPAPGVALAFPFDTANATAFFINNPSTRSYQPRAYSSAYTVPEKVYQYSVSVQQELFYNMVGTVAYVGSQGRNLFLRSVANRILPGQTTIANGATLPTNFGIVNRTNAAGQVIAVNTVREFSIVSGTSTVQNPFAEVDYKTSGGSDSYNALQLQLSRRFTTGLTMNAQYTFARSFGTTAGSNEARTAGNNARAIEEFDYDRGYNNFDIRHTFNLSALYLLPVGHGRKWDFGSVGNALFGDLEIGTIVNARSGLPIEIGIVRPDVVVQCVSAGGCLVATNASGGTTTVPNGFVAQLPTVGNGAQSGAGFNAPPLPPGFIAVVNTPGGGASRNVRRPNIVPGQPLYLDADRQLLNPAAFSTPAPGAFGDLPRNALRGPNFRQVDLILNKRFRLTETTSLEFRTEVFNIFNFTNFAVPSSTLNNALPSLTVINPTAANGLSAPIFTLGSTGTQPGQSFTQTAAGGTFGLLRQTVERTVGLGTNRQIQFALRLNF